MTSRPKKALVIQKTFVTIYSILINFKNLVSRSLSALQVGTAPTLRSGLSPLVFEKVGAVPTFQNGQIGQEAHKG